MWHAVPSGTGRPADHRARLAPAHVSAPLPTPDRDDRAVPAHIHDRESLSARPQRTDHRPGSCYRGHWLHRPHRWGDAGCDGRSDRVLGRRGLLRRPHRDGARQGPARVGLRHRRLVCRPGGRPVRRSVADHQVHQRYPAGPDAGDAHLHDDDCRTDHVLRRHHHGAAPRRLSVVSAGGDRPDPVGLRDPDHLQDAALVQVDAGEDRPAQQDPASRTPTNNSGSTAPAPTS
jgi:hypothetical protein